MSEVTRFYLIGVQEYGLESVWIVMWSWNVSFSLLGIFMTCFKMTLVAMYEYGPDSWNRLW